MARGFSHVLNSSPLKPGDLQLAVDGVFLAFGGVQALSGVSFQVKQSEIAAIIGPNGAGKTNLLNCVSGLYHPQDGAIRFYNGRTHTLTNLKPYQIAQLGIARSLPNIELFKHMSVLDNLMLGRHVHLKSNIFSGGLYWGRAQREEVENRKFLEDIIDLLEIEAIRKQAVGALSYGLQKRVELGRALALQPSLLILDEPMAGMNSEEQQMLAIGRALMAKPKLVMLDEPSLGLAPLLVQEIFNIIHRINKDEGTTILLVGQNARLPLNVADYAYIMENGRIVLNGEPEALKANADVREFYLGLNEVGARKSYRDVKHYKRRKRWLS